MFSVDIYRTQFNATPAPDMQFMGALKRSVLETCNALPVLSDPSPIKHADKALDHMLAKPGICEHVCIHDC